MNLKRMILTVLTIGSVQVTVLYWLIPFLLTVWLPRVVAEVSPGAISRHGQRNNFWTPLGLSNSFWN